MRHYSRLSVMTALALLAACTLWRGLAWAEYRAYELEVVDLYDCQVNKRSPCPSQRVTTAMAPALYGRTHGGAMRLAAPLRRALM